MVVMAQSHENDGDNESREPARPQTINALWEVAINVIHDKGHRPIVEIPDEGAPDETPAEIAFDESYKGARELKIPNDEFGQELLDRFNFPPFSTVSITYTPSQVERAELTGSETERHQADVEYSADKYTEPSKHLLIFTTEYPMRSGGGQSRMYEHSIHVFTSERRGGEPERTTFVTDRVVEDRMFSTGIGFAATPEDIMSSVIVPGTFTEGEASRLLDLLNEIHLSDPSQGSQG